MYKQVETDGEISLSNQAKVNPVATLADECGGRIQIGIDDHCYVLYLKIVGSDLYRSVTHIFKEVFEVLKTLPSPE